jgi:anti-sigma factor RsiW
MTGASDMRRLNAFIDGELGLQEQLEVESRLRDDAALRQQVERLRALRSVVQDRADYHAAPDDLRARIASMVAPSAPPSRERVRRFDWRPWSAGLALAGVAALALNLTLLQPREDTRIEQDVIASHVRATIGQRAVDIASSDHHTVKPWLSSKLDFSPPVPDQVQPGSALLGGRVDYIDGRPVAALAYRRGAHTVDDFIWPTTQRDKPVAMTSERGFNIAHWTRAGMTHWLISDLNASELSQMAAELSRD